MHPVETDALDFTPAHYGDAPGAPVYRLAPLGERDRLAAIARVTRALGRQVLDVEIDDMLTHGIRAVMGDDAERSESAMEELAALRSQNGSLDVTQAGRRDELLIERKRLERRVSRDWDVNGENPFNALVADAQMQEELTWFEFTLAMIQGWDGESLPPYERKNGRTSEAAFNRLPMRDRTALKSQAFYMAVGLTKALQGNSERPSSAGSSQETTRAAESPQAPEGGSIP